MVKMVVILEKHKYGIALYAVFEIEFELMN
jgi:hypothetical protein